MEQSKYIKVSTQEFKTHFAALVRQIEHSDHEGIMVKNHGRVLGIFVPMRQGKTSGT